MLGKVIEDQSITNMYINRDTMGNISDVIYSPSYYSSNQGILEVIDDSEDDVSLESYLYFDSVEYPTLESFIGELERLLERCKIFNYNISIQRPQSYDMIIITFIHGTLEVMIPKQANEMSIKRDYLFKRSYIHNNLLSDLNPIQKLSQLEIDIRNLS